MAVNVVLKSVFDDKGIKQAQNEFAKVGKTLGVAFAAVGAATLAAAAGLTKFGADSIAAAENVAQANNRLGQVAKSMGIFGAETTAVTQRLIKFAEANELTVAVDAEVIKATQAKLLTFKNLAETADEVGGSMDRATMAALDLAAAGFGSAETNAVQLGKALQDPIKGITALSRAGVTFTQVEREKIRALVESGKVLDAQNMILSAIETQVGGTAEATAKASDRMRLAFENISESVGEALLPVFNEFADEVIKLTPELEAALAPAAQEIADIFRQEVLPAVQNFTKWLASPQGTKTLRDLAQAVIDAVKTFVDFVGWTVRNRDAIIAFAVAIGTVMVAINLYKVAVGLATAAQLLFNSAALAFPFAAALAGLGAIAGASWLVYQNTKQTTEAMEEQRLEILRNEDAFTTAATNGSSAYKGLIPTLEYTGAALDEITASAKSLNGVSLAKFRGQLGDTRVDAERLVNAQRQLFFAMRGLPGATTPTLPAAPALGASGGAGSSGPSAFEQTQKIIKDAQKKLREANERYREAIASANKAYNKTIAEATKTYSESVTNAETRRDESLAQALRNHTQNIASIQRDFAQRQADIIQQSIDRLRNAYASAVRTNVADLFGTEEVGKSIDKLITNLRDRLTASRRLVTNTALLASQGFSQTFLEQVVGAGLETGNELADSILKATPETQAELKSLFGALESESETGMDSLARTMFEKTGLATTELKKLFSQTQTDLVATLNQAQIDYSNSQAEIQKSFSDAMAQAQKTRDDAFARANESLNEALSAARDQYVETINDIREAFEEQIAQLEGKLGGLGNTVKQLLALLASLGGAQVSAPKISTLPSFPSGGGAVIQTLPLPTQKPTVVNNNINIKTDATQSPAMVGAAVSKAINKYTGGGGGLRFVAQ